MSAAPPRTTGVRLLGALPLIVVAIDLIVATRSPVAGGALVGLVLLATLTGPRLDVDVATQRVFSLVLTILTVALFRSQGDAFPDSLLAVFWIGTATAALAVASFRLACRAPEGGLRGTIVLGAIALLACGAGRVGRGYAIPVAAFLFTTAWAFRAEDPARPPLGAMSKRERRASLLVTLFTALVAVELVAPLRPAAEWMQRRAVHAYDEAYAHRGGRFSDTMRIGRLDPMLRSDAVALRLRGPRVDLVRAVVFDRYDDGRFLHAESANGVTMHLPLHLEGADVVEVTRTRAATDRAPLPLGATELAAPSDLTREPFDVVHAPLDTMRYEFRAPRGEVSTAWPPSKLDTQLPGDLRPALTKIAREWAEGSDDPAVVLQRIERRLRRDYHYELGREHLSGRDPILHFLEKEPFGHCEYFAGATVLLARALGVPARMVAGYRVIERNPIDGHYVVRERNAHAWAEAWVPGRGWTVVDATPLTEDMREVTDEPMGTASEDAAIATWERIEAWLSERTLGELVTGALLGTALFAFVRLRRARKESVARTADPLGDAAGPSPHAAALLRALAERGLARGRAEPIERFAARVDDEKTAAVLLRYAAHRYGEVDDPELARDLRQEESAVRARAAASTMRAT